VSFFIHKKDGGLVLILISFALLLVGGGFGPPYNSKPRISPKNIPNIEICEKIPESLEGR